MILYGSACLLDASCNAKTVTARANPPARHQTGEVERMKSQIEDLKGMRRGTVSIACSQALALEFLPRQIAEFRNRHPLVSFDVKVFDHEQAMKALNR